MLDHIKIKTSNPAIQKEFKDFIQKTVINAVGVNV
jgi:hypothetical protein